jgi:hypothetical protein
MLFETPGRLGSNVRVSSATDVDTALLAVEMVSPNLSAATATPLSFALQERGPLTNNTPPGRAGLDHVHGSIPEDKTITRDTAFPLQSRRST